VVWFSFQSSQDGFGRYTRQVAAADTVRDLNRAFLDLRRFAREYAFTGTESNVERAGTLRSQLDKLLHQAADQITNPELGRRVEAIGHELQVYEADFDKLVARKRALIHLETSQLDPQGATGARNFEALVKAADANLDRAQVTNQAFRQFMAARIDVNKFLGRNAAAAGKAAEGKFNDLVAALAGMQGGVSQEEYGKTLAQVRDDISAYRDAFHTAAALGEQITQLVSQRMSQVAEQLQSEVEAITNTEVAGQEASLRDSLAIMTNGNRVMTALAVGSGVLSIFLAWWIGRAISAPTVALCRCMAELAAGNKGLVIPGLGRKDEIGQMANAVEVFKSGLVEADRLREQGERQKAEAEKQRKAAMLQVADIFEAEIKSVAQTVSSRAAEMQASAGSLTGTAQKATGRATAVAAAVEQASVNVQVVASSTEELSTSVHEIARQMAQASRIAGEAVQRAEGTNTIQPPHWPRIWRMIRCTPVTVPPPVPRPTGNCRRVCSRPSALSRVAGAAWEPAGLSHGRGASMPVARAISCPERLRPLPLFVLCKIWGGGRSTSAVSRSICSTILRLSPALRQHSIRKPTRRRQRES
jgi:HAMP domain-containing protein